MAHPPAAASRTVRRPPRGAALLVVIVSIAILTAIAVDLAYSARVSLLGAANARDELRAEYLARSGVQLSRLVLRFQKQLDDAVPATTAGAPRVQLFDVASVDRAITDGLFGESKGEGPEATFKATLEDEGRKVNAQLDGLAQGGLLGGQVLSFLQLVAEPRWDPLFEREDANGLKVTRTDLAVYLHDWTDDNSVGSAFSANPDRPFEDGYGDENQPYARGDDPYRAKNARFDSLDELYMVAGIDDAFMAAFGRQLTVYPHRDGRINVNTLDPAELLRNARIMAEPSTQPKLQDPKFPQELLHAVSDARLGGILSIRPSQLGQILRSFGIGVALAYQQENVAEARGAFTDRSLVYTIHSAGAAGLAERRVDAVVTFDTRQQGSAPSDMGRLLHWHEE